MIIAASICAVLAVVNLLTAFAFAWAGPSNAPQIFQFSIYLANFVFLGGLIQLKFFG